MAGAKSEFQEQFVIENLRGHVEHLSTVIGERHLWKEGSLNRAADYIESTLQDCQYDVWRQTYPCHGETVSNLVAEKKGTGEEVVIIGAHYDTVPGSPGADDNASAVAGLLELGRLLRDSANKKNLAFVAFVNEEPPFFGSYRMGSMVYARHLKEKKIQTEVMISLEMIGCFSKEKIQHYPFPGMGLVYPRAGDYIGVAGNFHSFKYVSLIKKGIRRYSNMNARSLIAPEFFGGINLSDNYSFWHHGYRAIMVTDTSFFRNKHYHQETDTVDTLNFEGMAEVVKGLYHTLSGF